MRGPEFFEMTPTASEASLPTMLDERSSASTRCTARLTDDGDRVDDDGQLVTPNDFKNGKLFEVKLKKKAKMILKE